MRRTVRRLVPRAVRRRASAHQARWHSFALRRRLSALAAGTSPIVAGPWLGEVGFELLYWVPFLRWFAREFRVDPHRMTVVSRGGPRSWYSPFAATYHDAFEFVTRDEFRRDHHERVRHAGEQKQTRTTRFERALLDRVIDTLGAGDAAVLHPSTMYGLFNPFWWMHVDERWVHRHARYERLPAPDRSVAGRLPESYVAVKFYFNECFTDADRNRGFARDLVRRLADRTPVVSLVTGLDLDDHGGCVVDGYGVLTPGLDLDPRYNLHVQSAVVAGASAFVGTYGGFSYLAPLYGVPTVAYYSNPNGFSPRHLHMARSAYASMDAAGAFDVRAVDEDDIAPRICRSEMSS